MWRLLLLCFLVPGVVFAQGPVETKREMGEEYRFFWYGVAPGEVVSPIMIRFPAKANDSNAIPLGSHGVYADSVITSTLGDHTVRWLELHQFTQSRRCEWIIYSPCFPAGVDTAYTNGLGLVPTFQFGGCPVDSVLINGIQDPQQQVNVTLKAGG